jgi:CBS domain-containing protein
MSHATVNATAEDVMTRPVARIEADEPVSAAAKRLYDDRIGSLLVESGGEVVGIVTETDVVGLVARDGSGGTPVGDIATESLVTVDREARIEKAAELMARNTIKKLPVTDDGEIVGMLTTTDISNYFPSYHPRDESWA